ncbi:MAG: hypothetical protein U0640_08885 [Phycisphaerales bacterium]
MSHTSSGSMPPDARLRGNQPLYLTSTIVVIPATPKSTLRIQPRDGRERRGFHVLCASDGF